MGRITTNSFNSAGETLSLRLSLLRSFHSLHSSEIYDIGCDHGLLGLSFLAMPSVSAIHLVDPSAAVVEKLKIKAAYITDPRIKIHHELGQNLKLGQSAKTIFIAGMGGKEIQKILINLAPQLNTEDRVVISPHRNVLELRHYLSSSDYRLIKEDLLEEQGHYYQLLCLSTANNLGKVSLFGEEIWKAEVARAYHSKLLNAYQSHQDEQSRLFHAFLSILYA
jgi:tRNA (adenine22-N1)-methyltransferase